MRNNLIASLIIVCGIVFSACTKDTSPPTIEITNPTSLTLTEFSYEAFVIAGTFSDSEKLERLEFKSSFNGEAFQTFKTINDFDSAKSHKFSEVYAVSSFTTGDVLALELDGYDAAGNNTMVEINITFK